MSLPDSLERLISLWGRFPGIGEKTARRMVFFMLGQERAWALALADAIASLGDQVCACRECGGITTADPCRVCSDPLRDRRKICVVETQEDCVAMEQSGVYGGLYHVLGGRCSPLDDQDVPEESLDRLKQRITDLGVTEVILALNPRIEGDLTAYVIQEALEDSPIKLSRLSYGLPVGGSIGFADRVTLHIALESRREVRQEER